MNIGDALIKVGEHDREGQHRRFNLIICKDGFSMSVQASRYHYCNPRELFDDPHKYTSFEVGALDFKEPMLDSYCEDLTDTNSVYGYVPVSVLNAIIKKHGGLADGI